MLPPLSLYVHIPWCVQKCPYCDFNSHQQKGQIPEQDYIQHLLRDLQHDVKQYQHALADRPIQTMFIGGGTPSLFSAEGINKILTGVRAILPVAENAEITMEANPGTAESERFTGFVQAGVTRLSMGVQSFADDKLITLGRIHDGQQAKRAIAMAQDLLGNGLKSFNLDLMHGLPHQNKAQALQDLAQAVATRTPHLSWYQLTIEPNTLFGSRPPRLPEDDTLWEIFEAGDAFLRANGYEQYETSAYAKAGFQCEHNLNYWRFGDYLAIGCGAHGKITLLNGEIQRFSKTKHPRGYLQGHYEAERHIIPMAERPFEYFMNRFRLLEPVPKAEFTAFTGCSLDSIQTPIEQAKQQGYINETAQHWQVTERGKLFLNELLTLFLTD